MRFTFLRLAAGSAAVFLSTAALAQDVAPPDQAPPPPDQGGQVQTMPQDQAPPPEAVPQNIPAPVFAQPGLPPGQWVNTAQYGWVWMPYGNRYIYQPTYDGGDPYMYLYSAAYGWRWLAAPWVYGVGPAPYWGAYGYAHYHWYGRGYYGHPWYGYRAGYPGYYRGMVYAHPAYVHRGYVGARPVVRRGGPVVRRPAPHYAPHGVYHDHH